MRRQAIAVVSVALVSNITFPAVAGQQGNYITAVDAWRAQQERNLSADDGWLTVTGLFFLGEGENPFGTSPLNDIVLPEGPSEAGVFVLANRRVILQAATGHKLTVNGEQVTKTEIYPRKERADITIDDLTLFVHHSGHRLAIRMRDANSALRQSFTGRRWYPVDKAYRVPARFVPHDSPIKVTVQNILGDVETLTSSGSVMLSLNGEKIEMLPVDSEGQLWFIFRDLTSGTETYTAARFLYADAPENGWTVVDFNKAYNPPCAFNPYTTCPLPPKPNRLRVRVEAGELDYSPGH